MSLLRAFNIYRGGGAVSGFINATGGDEVIEIGNIRYHIFKTSGNFTILNTGTLDNVLNAEIYAAGGTGGRSDYNSNALSGGGGAGEQVLVTDVGVVGTFPVAVGAALKGPGDQNGGDSSFYGFTALGGGHAGSGGGAPNSGGCGGGGASTNNGGLGNLGFRGGNASGGTNSAGGGGGMASAGTDGDGTPATDIPGGDGVLDVFGNVMCKGGIGNYFGDVANLDAPANSGWGGNGYASSGYPPNRAGYPGDGKVIIYYQFQ